MLRNSRIGLYVANSAKDEDAKNAIVNLAQAAMQNDKATLGDIIKVMKSNSLQDVEEQLAVADAHAQQREDAIAQRQQQHEKEMQAMVAQAETDRHKNAIDEIITKAREDRQTKKEVAAITALGFAEDKDVNDNITPDVLEVAKIQGDLAIKGQKAATEERSQSLEEQKFQHQKAQDEHQKKIDKEYVEIDRKKASKPTGQK